MSILVLIDSCTITLITLLTTHALTHGNSYLVNSRLYLVYKDPCRETCLSGSFFCAIQVVSSKPDWTPSVSIVHNAVLNLGWSFYLLSSFDSICKEMLYSISSIQLIWLIRPSKTTPQPVSDIRMSLWTQRNSEWLLFPMLDPSQKWEKETDVINSTNKKAMNC